MNSQPSQLAQQILSNQRPWWMCMRMKSRVPVLLEHICRVPVKQRAQTKVLELPAGPGHLTGPLKAAGFDVTAADLFPEYHDLGLKEYGGQPLFSTIGKVNDHVPLRAKKAMFPDWQEGAPEPTWPTEMDAVEADMTSPLPFDDCTFDIATCIEGIEHVTDRTVVLNNFRRVLKPGGVLIITTPNILNLRSRLANAFCGDRSFNSSIDEITTLWGASEDGKRLYHGHAFLVSYLQLRYNLGMCGFAVRGLLRGAWSGMSLGLAGAWPLVALGTRYSQKKARRAFKQMKGKGDLPRDYPPPHNEIVRDVSSAACCFNRSLMVVAEAVEPRRPLRGSRTQL